MKKLLASLVSMAVLVMAPTAEAAEKAHTSSGKAKVSAKKHVKSTRTAKSAQQKKVVKKATKTKLAAKKSGKRVKSVKKRAPVMAINYDDAFVDGELNLRSHAALVIDQQTGEALYAKNPELATPIASITKLMTAMVTLDAGLDLNEEVEISSEDVDRLKYTSSRLPLGARLARGELMHLALIASENRAAAALSRAYPGGRDAFVMAMNRKAIQLGMDHTYFVDGTGLSSSNRSTAADLAKMVDAAYSYPTIRAISTTGSYDVALPVRAHYRNVAFNNTNALTRSKDWDIGISKTGFINEAGHCLVMQANIAKQRVIIVLLDSWGKFSRIGDAGRIRKWLENGAAGKVAARRTSDSA